jgi:stage III sporulation protein AA
VTHQVEEGPDERIWQQVLHVCPPDIRGRLEALDPIYLRHIEEIRLRLGQPVQISGFGFDRFLGSIEDVTSNAQMGLRVTEEHLSRVLQAVTQASLYAVEDDLRKGFVTMQGGHRVGVAGRTVLGVGGEIRAVRSIYSVNLRVARERPGCAGLLSRYAFDRETGRPLSMLLISPPQCGKTTLLRDVARLWSWGGIAAGVPAAKVTIVDERSELAGSVEGRPQFDIGPRTDLMDGCPKAEGMRMAIRSLSPGVIVTDEIGREDDVRAVLDATHAGVAVVTSVHAASVDEWRQRPAMEGLYRSKAFKRYVLIGRDEGPGTILRVEDEGQVVLYRRTSASKRVDPG